MPKIQLPHMTMYYECHGKGEPLVLIAGFGADHTTWCEVIEGFSRQYQVIVLDNRGAGQTDLLPGLYSVRDMADDVAALCKQLQLNPMNVIGNSMGGCIAQALAFHHPALVKSLVLSNTTLKSESPFHVYLKAQLALLKANAPIEELIKATSSWIYSAQFLNKPKVLDQLVELILMDPHPFTLAGYEAQLHALQMFDSRAWISQITSPSLVLGADQDLIFSEAATRQMATLLPASTYYCFNHCGHLPHVEYPKLFVEQVCAFFRNFRLTR